MTAESQIEAIVNDIRTQATANSTLARQQLELTQRLIEQVKFVNKSLEHYPSRPRSGKYVSPEEPGLNPLTALTPITPPDKVNLLEPSQIPNRFSNLKSVSAPTFTDLFKHKKPSPITPFTKTPPNITLNPLNVTIPPATPIPNDLLELIKLKSDFKVPDPALPPPPKGVEDIDIQVPTDLSKQFTTAYRSLQTEIRAYVSTNTQTVIRQFFPQVASLTSLVDEHFKLILQGDKTVWAEKVEDKLYSRALIRAEQQRLSAQQEIDTFERRSGAVSLSGFSRARHFKATLAYHDAGVIASAETAQALAKLELDHFEFCATAVSNIRQQATSLLTELLSQALSELTLASNIAQVSTDYVIKTVEVARDILRLRIDKNANDIAIWQTLVEYVKLEFEVFSNQIEAEKLKSDINKDKLATARLIAELDSQILDRVELQIKLLTEQNEVLQFPLKLFQAEIDAYRAYASGKGAESEVFTTLFRADEAILKGRLTPFDVQKLDIDARLAALRGDTAMLEAVEKYNAIKLAEQEQEFDIIKLIQQVDKEKLNADIAVNQQLLAQFQAIIESRRIGADFSLREWEQESTNIYRENQSLQEQNRNLTQFTLEQLRTVISSNLDMGKVLAEMAGAAMTALNGMVSLSNTTNQ